MSEQTPKSIISELAAAAGLQTLEKYAEVDNKKQRLFIGIPREIAFQENRVPLTPDSVETLVAQGHRIVIESKAGDGARFSDKDYSEAGAQIYYDRKQVFEADIIVDCIFGTGLNKELDEDSVSLINSLNNLNSFKSACDIPSGINSLGQITQTAFKADITLTMGALKTSLFSDITKDYTGEIIVCNLGVQRVVYEINSNKYLLEKSDMNLPLRNKKNSHKGSFGHLNVVSGTKKGASIICAEAGFSFGHGNSYSQASST